MNRELLRTYVSSAYDLQDMRVQLGNRLVANFKSKLGQKPGMTEEELEKLEKDILDKLRASHKRLADAMPKRMKDFKGDELITEYAEYTMVNSYMHQLTVEEDHFAAMKHILQEFPIYTEFLSKVKGIGPAMAGVIVSEFDPHKAEYPSSFWRYAGLDVGDDGRGRSRKAEHLIDREYEPKGWKAGQPLATRKSITFNPFLKTKLIGVMGPSFIKASRVLIDGENMSTVRRAELAKGYGWDPKTPEGKVKDPQTARDEVFAVLKAYNHEITFDNSPYQVMYQQYKNRLKNMPQHAEKSDLHHHNMAIRYAVKGFLIDLYKVWRALEGLPVAPSYAEAKLGMEHGRGASDGRYSSEFKRWPNNDVQEGYRNAA